jgi:hypothetical protein
MDTAKIIAKMSETEQMFCLLCGVPRNDEWKVFLPLMMDKNPTMTARPDEIITKLVEKEAAIKIENGLVQDARLFAKKCGNGGNGEAGKSGRSPKRNMRHNKKDNKDDRKEKNFRKCFHCHWGGHTTENCLSKHRGDPPKSSDTAAKSSTQTTSIENYWMVASGSTSSSDCFIDCGCTTDISDHQSMIIT